MCQFGTPRDQHLGTFFSHFHSQKSIQPAVVFESGLQTISFCKYKKTNRIGPRAFANKVLLKHSLLLLLIYCLCCFHTPDCKDPRPASLKDLPSHPSRKRLLTPSLCCLKLGFFLCGLKMTTHSLHCSHQKVEFRGTSLVVQRLRHLTPTAGASSSVPGWGTKIPHASWNN